MWLQLFNMSKIVNLAIQILPLNVDKKTAYSAIDAAIAVAHMSGLKYQVCPFETVLEGPYTRVMEVAEDMQQAIKHAGIDTILVNMKLHRGFAEDQYIDDKIEKYHS